LDEFFMRDFHRVDHRSIVGGGVLDAATTTAMAESMVALAGRVRTEPIVTRGDLLALSRGITVYGSAAESAYLMGSEVDASARQARIDVFDEDALDEAMAELNRRWLDSLSPTEQETVGVAARWAQASRAPWDLEAFDELLEEEFEAHDGSRLGAGRLDREQFLSSQRARAELQGRADETTIDLMELPRPDVLLSRLRSTGTGSRWDTDWETRWIVVHQVAGDHVRRFGLFDDTDLDGARDWAAALGPETDEESRFDTLSTRVAACFRAAMNDGSVAERLDEFFEPDWRRVDHRSVIGTGELDATTFAEILATVDFETRSTHLAVRGDLLLLSRGTTNYGVDRESSFLVLSEIGPEGRQRRSDLYDEDAFDEAITEMDRLWRRTLTDEERTTLRVTGEFGRAFMEQDHAVFDRILHPNFTSMEHGVFQGGELDRAAWEPMNRDRNDVFGRGRLFIDIVELPSPHVVLSRTTQTGTSEGGMAWEVAEWTVLQMADGKIVRAEVLDADPEIAQADRARRIAGELVEQDTRSAFGNRAVHIASVIAAAWNAGDSGSRFFTVDFVWLDRRSAEPDPDDPRADLLSVVLSGQPGPTGLAASERHCEIGDVLLACDESFALVPLRIAFDLGGAERGVLMAVACDDDGQLARAAVFGPDQEDAARRELTLWWAAALQPRRMEVSQLAVAFGESWVAPTSRPLGDMMAPDFRLVDGRTLGLGDLDREGFIQALVGREEDGTTGPPLPSRVEFVSDDVLVFRAANRGVTPGTGVEWEEIACNVLVTDGPAVQRVEMFDENQWDAAVARAREIAEGAYHRSSSGPINPDQTVDSPSTPPSH